MYSQNNKIILHVSCKPQNIYLAVKSLNRLSYMNIVISRLSYFYISNINTHRERGMPLRIAH